MTDNLLAEKFRSLRIGKNLTEEELAEKLGVDVVTITEFENGTLVPSLNFFEKAEAFFDFKDDGFVSFNNIFTQGYFGTKVPLLRDEDLVADNSNRVIYYFELPHLSKYGEDNLFALRYLGKNQPKIGIMHDSILVFVRCSKIDRDGIYAVIKRKSLSIRSATITNGKIRMVNLSTPKELSTMAKSSVAAGRLVCCINNF